MSSTESSKEKKLRHLREEERRAAQDGIGRTGRLIEHGEDAGYEALDFDKRARMQPELDAIRKEIRQVEQS